MDLYTLDREFVKRDVISVYNSLIWTERYYGDGEVTLTLPFSLDILEKLKIGTFLSIDESEDIMIVETLNIEGGNLKVFGITLLRWMNNRIIRASAKHEDRYWYLSGKTAGSSLWWIIFMMVCWQSNFVQESYNYGIPHASQLAIDGFTLGSFDDTGSKVDLAIPYGPLYDAMKDIAQTYEIGMKIRLEFTTNQPPLFSTRDPFVTPYPAENYYLAFYAYRGTDRTSAQSTYPTIRFSPQMDSFSKVKELLSAEQFKSVIYAFAPSNPAGYATGKQASVATLVPYNTGTGNEIPYHGWDVRAALVFADDLTTDNGVTSASNFTNLLNQRAQQGLIDNKFISAVDGEVVPGIQFEYGIDYFLGDIIEVQGNMGVINRARITEYIRAQDSEGLRGYPTVQMFTN